MGDPGPDVSVLGDVNERMFAEIQATEAELVRLQPLYEEMSEQGSGGDD